MMLMPLMLLLLLLQLPLQRHDDEDFVGDDEDFVDDRASSRIIDREKIRRAYVRAGRQAGGRAD